MPFASHSRTGPGTRRAALFVASALVLLLALGGTVATPQGRIVVHGAHSGSHLKLNVRGDRLIVRGWMARAKPAGCRFVRYRAIAVCRLAGAGSVEVRMGPSGDMVEVLDRLPVPLTAYLGDGSDKFVGNGEPDTCYSEGARRNRCIGRGGDDVCITGQRNSDCIGGRGNDYCQTGAGSDGCWGGPGRDVCRMGPGHDACHGNGGRDRLYGGPSSDKLYGGRGRDYCDGGRGWGYSHNCEAGPRR
ncbi:MAG: calcium-binding protein [Solirubrobacterales bacterium]|nr:calcium-binding protein [Solirubrobacterales bacterium]